MLRVITVLLFGVMVNSSAMACLSVSVSASNLNFGVYNSLDSLPLESDFSVTLECITDGVLPALHTFLSIGISSLSGGQNGAKRLTSGVYQLEYTVGQPSNSNVAWGGVGSSNPVTVEFLPILDPPSRTLTGNGRIPARQNVGIGVYSDILMVVVEF